MSAYKIVQKFGFYSVCDNENNIIANYRDQHTAQHHLNALNEEAQK